MLGLFTKSARRNPLPQSSHLRVERLDDRIAPAAPVIDTFSVHQVAANTFELYGHVTDEAPLGLAVYFGGDVQAAQKIDAICDANGYFSVTFVRSSASDYGYITADCMDWNGEAAKEKSIYLA